MKNIYFASDFHLGVDARLSSVERERQIVRWLDQIAPDAEELFLVGDLFDFWFEYKYVVPKGYVRLLGKLAQWRDAGIPIHVFTGNHDMWMFQYFEEELGIPVHREPVRREWGGKQFLIGHGDGLGPGDYGYKVLKKVFRSPLAQWLFARLHPNFSFWMARFWSRQSRKSNPEQETFLGEDKEWLLQYCEALSQNDPVDYFIFGHRHLPIDFQLKNSRSRYINLGEWLRFNSYAIFNGQELELRFFENPNPTWYSNHRLYDPVVPVD